MDKYVTIFMNFYTAYIEMFLKKKKDKVFQLNTALVIMIP